MNRDEVFAAMVMHMSNKYDAALLFARLYDFYLPWKNRDEVMRIDCSNSPINYVFFLMIKLSSQYSFV